MKNNLPELTKEQRQEFLEKAKASKQLKRDKALSLNQNLKDKDHWTALASSFGVRLPVYYIGPDEASKYLKRIAKKLDVNIEEYIESTGYDNIKQLSLANPTYPCYAICGLFLEWIDENKNH